MAYTHPVQASGSLGSTRKKAKALLKKEKYAEAESLWAQVATHYPDDAEAYYHYALCLRHNNKLELSLKVAARALELSPSSDCFLLMGQTYRDIRMLERAEKTLTQAINYDESNHRAWGELAIVYCLMGKYERAILLTQKASEIKGADSKSYDIIMAMIFANFSPKSFNADFKKIIERGLSHKNVNHTHYTKAWIQTLFNDPVLHPALLPFIHDNQDSFDAAFQKNSDAIFFKDPFFINGVKMLRLTYTVLEDLMRHMRSCFLRALHNDDFYPAHRDLLFAMAHQCFGNEYVFFEPDYDKAPLQALTEELRNTTPSDITNLPEKMVVLGCYQSLHQSDLPNTLFKHCKSHLKQDQALQDVIRIQYDEPLKELEIKKTIKAVGTIQNEISQKVQEQYEENPYPRWTDYADQRETDFKIGRVSFSAFECKDVLIAGCGTGQQVATNQFNFPDAHVTAVDISRSSLSYAIRKAQEFQYKNVDFYQADILELESLGKTFDYITCTGVLHHMHDPMAGWSVLEKLLRPGGYMFIGLYSESARKAVKASIDFIAEHKYDSNLDGIRACREHLKTLPKTHPAAAITESGDFYTLSTCRDLIFHVQEHRYTIPMIKESLDTLGLEFLEMTAPTPEDMKLYKQMFPGSETMNDLDKIDEFEQKRPLAFRRMYQFWLRKPD